MIAAYVNEAVRTPFGRYGGALAGVRPDDPSADARAMHDLAGCQRREVRRHVRDLSPGTGRVRAAQPSAGGVSVAPLVRIVARGVHGIDPDVFEIAPAEAATEAVAHAGIGWDQSTSSKATRWGHRAARILGRIAQALRARGGGYGVAVICIGVGQGLAVVLEG